MVLKFCQHVYVSMWPNDILTTLCPFFLIFYAFFSTTVTRSDKSLSSQSAIFFVDWVGGVLQCYNANIWVLLSLRRGGEKATNCAIFSVEVGHKQWADLHTLSHYDKAKKTIYFRRNGKLALPTPIPLKKVEGMNAIHIITYLFMY